MLKILQVLVCFTIKSLQTDVLINAIGRFQPPYNSIFELSFYD